MERTGDSVGQRAMEVRRLFWERFVHPETNLILDHHDPPDTFHSKNLPTAEEISQCIGRTGWSTGMDDGGIHNGVYLASLVQAAEVGKDEEAEELARKILDGCVLLGTVGKPGFVARGVLPDRKSYCPNSSVDQYTMYVYGMWRYYHSSFALAGERSQIRDILGDIAVRIVNDEYTITRDDGNPNASVCDLEKIRPDRSSRLLEILLAACDVCEDGKWYDEYLRAALEKGGARLRSIKEDQGMKWTAYALQQSQVSLRLLYEVEEEPERKEVYRDSMRHVARRIEPQLVKFQDLDVNALRERVGFDWRSAFQEPHGESREHMRRSGSHLRSAEQNTLGCEFVWVAEPLEAAMTILLSEDEELIASNAELMREMLTEIPFELCYAAHSLCNVEEVFYWGVKRGLWELDSHQ